MIIDYSNMHSLRLHPNQTPNRIDHRLISMIFSMMESAMDRLALFACLGA
jgi:hypothetical protein